MPEGASRGRLLGVDVGSVRVGVALSDPDATLATPLTTLPRDAGGGTDLQTVVGLVAEHGVRAVIVGLPRHLNGTEGAAAQAARDWARDLRRRLTDTAIDIRLVDERLTTVDAHRRLSEAGVPGRRQRGRVDTTAAVLILQNALDTQARAEGRIPAGERVTLEEPPTADPPRPPRKPRHRGARAGRGSTGDDGATGDTKEAAR